MIGAFVNSLIAIGILTLFWGAYLVADARNREFPVLRPALQRPGQNICMCQRRQPQNPNAPIWRLPPELFQLVAETMPPSSAAAFALTSQVMLNSVGHQFLKLQCEELIKLLENFEPDMPDHLLCYQCCTFHH